MATTELSATQMHALFDILTHYETYSEIQSLQSPETIRNYGHPFTAEVGETSAPVLQMMMKKFVMRQPGISSFVPGFWQERIYGLVSKMGEAELSDSYDKGVMGTRKTLSSAAAVIIESAARGWLGGCPKAQREESDYMYDKTKAADIIQACNDATQDLVYGDLIDELFDGLAESAMLEDRSPLVQAVFEYLVIIAASFVHHIFVLSPDGQYLLKLLENCNYLVPYTAIKQTLRVGNAATMINGMTKLMLTKLSLTAMTNWLGLSKNTNDGMNLLQRIISTVFAWDNSDFRSVVSKVEKSKESPSKEHLKELRSHVAKSRAEHDKTRTESIALSKSIVTVIFESASPPLDSALTESQHAQALEYYSALVSIRDREELTSILCRQYPDMFTQAVNEVVAAYEPLIRSIHNGVDLSSTTTDLQNLLDDLIKLSKPKKDNLVPPSIEDYVDMLRRHVPSYLRFIHQIAKNCPEVTESFREWAKEAVVNFRTKEDPTTKESHRETTTGHKNGAAGNMTKDLSTLFSALPVEEQLSITAALNAHSNYLDTLEKRSKNQIQSILDSKSATMYGPGMYLARWHGLLDETLITSATAFGSPRHGKDVKFREEEAKSGGKTWWDTASLAQKVMGELPQQPDVEIICKVLGGPFGAVLKAM
ncbi:hypothetical protein PVAG01_09261 [Phlyctema vagabunda]|uniref:Uncharacterized protein n=1 Tax=Phlyctema vagabunda TaxID=108571 RepID=A0ABR4P6W1_9HELO